MSSLERLADATPSSEPVRAALRGRRYGEDRLYLLVRDPRSVFAAWELTPALHARGEELARAAGAPTRYQARVERRVRDGDPASACAVVDLPDALGGEGWYIDLPVAGGECRALLGLDLPAGFVPLLTSRWVSVPPEGPGAQTGEWEIDARGAAWLEREFALERASAGGAVATSGARFLESPSPRRA